MLTTWFLCGQLAPMPDGPVSLRSYERSDLSSMYLVCLETGAAGGDATQLSHDPALLGHVYVGPYVRHDPQLAVVAEDADGIAGYAVAARDAVSFGDWAEHAWWPALRRHYPVDADYPDFDRRLVELIHTPPAPSPQAERFPSELHIDLVPRAQGTGAGRRLMDQLLDALRAAGSPGVHFGVDPRNEHARGFYRHFGFTEHDDEGSVVFTMSLPGA